MNFDFQIFIMDQFVLMFLVMVVGLLAGKLLKIGTSGALFLGLGAGWGVTHYAQGLVDADAASKYGKVAKKLLSRSVVDETFFTMFLILFVVAVALLAGEKIGFVVKKYGAKFIILGFIITFVSAAGTYGLTIFSKSSNPYQVSGVYTGALTSSPGLAAAIETAREHAKNWADTYATQDTATKEKILSILGDPNLTLENTKELTDAQKAKFITTAEAGIGVGHAVGYPWGVIIVIIAMKFFPKMFGMNMDVERERFRVEMQDGSDDGSKAKATTKNSIYFDLTAFMFVCVAGYFVGTLKIYLGPTLKWFSLGATGGVLLIGLYLSHLGQVGPFNFRMDKKVLGIIREIGLTMFLGIVGLRYGYEAVNSLTGSGLWLSIIAIVVGILGMLVGLLIGKYVMNINWIMLSGAICGGMTSTPGLGAAVDAVGSDDPASGYGATYPFALFGMVLFSIVLHNLPM